MVSDHLKKIVLSPEFDVLKIALAPPLICKIKHKNEVLCKRKGYFFFSVLKKKNKGLKIIMSFSCVTE